MVPSTSRVVAVLQARMGSKRLPGKILARVGGLRLLELIVRRVASSVRVNQLIVATTELPQDDSVPVVCGELGVRCFRGAAEDCLDRIYRAVADADPDVVVRLTGDNPALDGRFVDWVVDSFFAHRPSCDYVDTTSHGTFPYGLSVETISFGALRDAWREATDATDREHVTKFVRERPERFKHFALSWKQDDHALRLTVDYPEDLQRMRELFGAANRWDAPWEQLIELARELQGGKQQPGGA